MTGLVGALVRSSYKWGYFVFGCAALLGVVYNVLWTGRKHAGALGADINRVYLLCGCWTIALWFLYPIAWGLCEGGNVISPDSEAVFYGILDILAKPVFGALLIAGHRNIDPARMGVHMRDYDHPIPSGGQYATEKSGHHHNGVGDTIVEPVPITTTGATTTTAV